MLLKFRISILKVNVKVTYICVYFWYITIIKLNNNTIYIVTSGELGSHKLSDVGIFVIFLKQFNSWVITLGSSNLELSKRDQSAEKSTSKIENDPPLNGATPEAQNDLEELQISHENVSPLHYLS